MRAGAATQTSGGRGSALGPGGTGSPAEGDPRLLSVQARLCLVLLVTSCPWSGVETGTPCLRRPSPPGSQGEDPGQRAWSSACVSPALLSLGMCVELWEPLRQRWQIR